jgi:hypothetical protein
MTTKEMLAADITEALIQDLRDRKGFDDVYDSLDNNIKKEIASTWHEIIEGILEEEDINV